MNISRLCDVYGALLTEHRREMVRNYYDYDLSLAEIAENFGITRQAALCSIKQAEKQLLKYESALGVVDKSDKTCAAVQEALRLLDVDRTETKRILKELLADQGTIGD